ncbi:late expression factor-2 [Maruca vitrata nucleopolyhedrovirus]|uniref:Late expression factor-2 n=1 Tax=Maruca vitrata nucleopolyhedrovirus TaxID=1307954 RepID=A1YRI8_9ABAC|nr:late expression factor-2 [Maruca vitrata nucleopolyhedrovirus]ABM05442.1 late expression factor-2 [Maruca vitrata nucleopolyhedrovirus]
MSKNMATASYSVWSPLITASCLDKKATYLIDPDDFIDKLTLTPYTVFYNGGVLVKISGLRLFMLLTAAPIENEIKNYNFKKRSKKNICMKECNNVVDMLNSKIDPPPCIRKILRDLKDSNEPRGGMYRKRFILNCYIANVVSCVKCQNRCLINALTDFYNHDSKCVGEVIHLFIKSQNVYKPPNCQKMKTIDKLCPFNGKCKGLNPICNY